MQNPYKKITASLLLFSHMLTSCYNPNIGIGKQALPTPDPADKQRQYAGEPHDKYPPKPTSHTLTTADKHPITFTYQNGQWQAAVEEHAAHGSCQRRQVPVVFEPGLVLEDVVDSNPTEQRQLLHLCPSEEEPDQPGYVYVGREPSQAKPQPQLLSSPAARQTALPSAVGLAQQQATAQPQQRKTSLQQAQEQPGPQAVLALPSPVQEIGEGPRSQDQLPTTPARVISNSLSIPSRETPSQRVAQKQPTSTQQTPSRRALSWRNQHELLHSQRAAQAKRAQSAAMAKPGNELAQPAAPSLAIVATPMQPPSLAHKAPPGIATQNLLAQGGQQVRFMHQDGQWQARVMERIGVFSRVMTLPVACERHGDVAKALAALQAKPTQYTRSRIHVMHTKQIPYVPQFVYLGVQGLQGGGNGADEPSGSGEPQDEPAAEEQAKHGPSKAVKIFKGEGKEGVDLRKYDSWYDNTTLEYLANTLREPQRYLLKVVFHDHTAPKTSFANQLEQLQLLKNRLNKKAGLFISKEPGAGVNHYLFGMLYGNQLILLNPVGASKHQDLYEALAGVKEQGLVEEVYLSRTRIQQEESLVSCGPISAELLLHYGEMDEEDLEEVVSKICSVGKEQEKEIGQGQEARRVSYQEVEVSQWLPATLSSLSEDRSGSKASYEEQVSQLRLSQLSRLEQVPSELEEELPEQVLFTELVVQDKGILALEDSESYKQLAKRESASELAHSPITGSGLGGGASVRQVASTSQGVHGRIPAEAPAGRGLQPASSSHTAGGKALHDVFPRAHALAESSAKPQGDPPTGEQSKDGPSKAVQHFKGGGVRGGLCELPPREQAKPGPSKPVPHSISGLAVPRALELPESKGPTQFELDQIEIKRLKEEIDEKLPQATQEADSQVVHELITRLESLLKLEALWAPGQGDDGAKEYIARLREAHRTKWDSTESGAAVNKQLTALLEQAYGQELRRLATERLVTKTSEGVSRLVQVLGQLAALHQDQGAATGDLAYYTDAAILYQNVLRICEEEMKQVESETAEGQGYQEQIAAAYRGLAKIRSAMVASIKGGKEGVVGQGGMRIAQLQEEIARDKQVLKALRADAKAKVGQLEALLNKQGSKEEVLAGEKAYIKGSRALFGDIAKRVRKFLGRLYQESEQALGPAPCKYTVMGLGSMALEQMTPYSDLEFAILMEEAQDEAAAKEYRKYLRQLTHLVHCRVINLGETTIPISKYKISLDHLSKRGLNFDLGGKTPLGRKDKFYDLIQPVAGMMRYLKNEENKIAHIDKNLPYILESTCYVHGDKELHEAYAAKKRAFLAEGQTAAGLPAHEARAFKKLLAGVVELDYSHPGVTKARHQQGDLAAFEPQFGLEDAGRLYDVKQEIYRLPDRLLYGLAMYYGLLPKSGWDAVDQLASRGIIGVGAQEASHHLHYAVSFATMLRLRTYLHHDQQAEHVTMLRRASPEQAQQGLNKLFVLPEEALQERGSLFKYYYTALPLHRKMEEFFNLNALALREQLPELSEWFRLDKDLDHSQIETGFWRIKEDSPSKKAVPFQAEDFYDATANTKGDIHRRLLDHEAAKECYEQALASDEQDYGPEAPEVAASLHKLGDAYQQLGDPKQAISYYERALRIIKQFYGPGHTWVAIILDALGAAWYQLGDRKQAISYLEQALDIYKKVYNPEHPRVAGSLRGVALAKLGESRQAISYCERLLDIEEQAYGPQHPHVATILNSLGSSWDNLGDSKQAIEYFERALHIYEQAYGPDHPRVALILNNLSNAWIQGDHKQAISYLERALAISEQAYGPDHLNVATSLGSLGSAWYQLGDHKQAISYLERALASYQQAYGPEAPEVAASLNNLGSAWDKLGDPKQAISYYERALHIYEQAYGAEPPKVATILSNLGGTWYQLGDHKEAISYFERELAVNKKSYGPEHPEMATSLNNLGSAWLQLGDSKQAISYLERALATYEKAYGPEHPHVATSLNNLGEAWNQLGDRKQAISYLERALAITENAYGPEHPEMATRLNKVGSAWLELGDSKQATECLKRALAIIEKVYGPEHREVAANLNNLGEAYRQLGDPKQAISYLERALPIIEKSYSPEHPHVAASLNNLGLAWDELGDSKQAISYSERALHIMKKAYGEDHPTTQRIKHNMEWLSSPLENNLERQVDRFIQACVAGKEDLATSVPMCLVREDPEVYKDRKLYVSSIDIYDKQGNPLICWMAQHEMMATLEQVLKLNWNPNLPNMSQVYPLHYGAMKNPSLVRLLLPYADPFVQTAKGSTPAMVAKSKKNMEALSLLLPSVTGLSLQDSASFDTSYETCKAHFLATPTHSFEHLVQVFVLACHFKDWELAREVATRHNVRPILSQVTQQYPAAGKSLLACIDSFTEACKAGNDTLAAKIPGEFTFEKDLYDAQDNPLIGWMAQHAMMATLEQVLQLGWNPNLPNTSHVYPLHYAAMRNPDLTSRLLQAGAHPFVQTAKGNTPAQVASSKGKVATLAVLLPRVEELSFKDAAAFEESYQAYKQHFPTCHQDAEELLAALELALQLGDADLTLAIQAKQTSQNLLRQLIDQYPLAADAIQARFASMLP